MHESHEKLSLLACKIAGQVCAQYNIYPPDVFSGSKKTSAVKARETIIEIIDLCAGWRFSNLNTQPEQHRIIFVGDDLYSECKPLPTQLMANLLNVDRSSITYARARILRSKTISHTP